VDVTLPLPLGNQVGQQIDFADANGMEPNAALEELSFVGGDAQQLLADPTSISTMSDAPIHDPRA
jgi:hypothetical protein